MLLSLVSANLFNMNLLPKSHLDFGEKDYWNSFFKKRGAKAFEWYGEYPELCGILHKYIKNQDEILMIGCGNSTLSADLYSVGYKTITNIDISQVVIKQMKALHKEKPEMEFLHMDALSMSFADNKFSVVLDKGTLDALMPDDTEEVRQRIDKFFNEIRRVLRTGGRYICISLLQDQIVRKLVEYFSNADFFLRIVRCHEVEQKTAESGESTVMPVFAIIVTKFKNMKASLRVLEVCMAGDKIQRLSSPDELITAVQTAQQASLVTSGMANNSLVGLGEVYLDVFRPGESKLSYSIFVLDQSKAKGLKKFAAFIVPQGRELDWMFSTPQGRKELLKSAGFERLAIISMVRDQKYGDLKSVQEELSSSVKSLAPKELTGQIPFISLGSDVGYRNLIHKGFSQFSGHFVVEEIGKGDKYSYRRLIFLDNQFVIQSECRIKPSKNAGDKPQQIDFGYLACSHHIYMTVGVQLAIKKIKKAQGNVAIIGLGGGGLCTFLHECFNNIKITAVDIDEAILAVAQDYFGLNLDDRLNVSIEDGIVFLAEAKKKGVKYNAILFDVDSKDTNVGMSCPPKQFVDKNVLDNVNSCLKETGFFILNLVCRDEQLRKDVICNIKTVFENIASYKLDSEVNEVVFCSKKSISNWNEEIQAASKIVNSNTINKKLQNDEIVDISSLLDALNVNL